MVVGSVPFSDDIVKSIRVNFMRTFKLTLAEIRRWEASSAFIFGRMPFMPYVGTDSGVWLGLVTIDNDITNCFGCLLKSIGIVVSDPMVIPAINGDGFDSLRAQYSTRPPLLACPAGCSSWSVTAMGATQ